MKNSFVDNWNLFIFIVKKTKKNLLAILLIISFPFLLIFLVCFLFKTEFSLVFNYIFSIYSIIITVVLFDYVLISRLHEAKFYNSEEKVFEIRESLNFVQELMLSNKTIPVKEWKDNISFLNSYNKLLQKNDKLYLAKKKDVFADLMRKLDILDSNFNYSEPNLDFSILTSSNRELSSECNDKLLELISDLSFEEDLDRK